MELSDDQYAQLVGGGECYLHHHPKEPLDFTDRVRLMEVEPTRVVTGTYSLTRDDELVLADTSTGNVVVALPPAARGREFQIVKTSGANTLFIVPTLPNTVLGSTAGLRIVGAYSSLHFKAVTGGYILV